MSRAHTCPDAVGEGCSASSPSTRCTIAGTNVEVAVEPFGECHSFIAEKCSERPEQSRARVLRRSEPLTARTALKELRWKEWLLWCASIWPFPLWVLCPLVNCRMLSLHKLHGLGWQPWFYLRLEAYSFVGLSEGAYGAS